MSITKGTPASSQIIWLEDRVKEQEEEIERLRNEFEEVLDRYGKENERLNKEIDRLRYEVEKRREDLLWVISKLRNDEVVENGRYRKEPA